MAILNIIAAMIRSSTFQKIGLDINLDAALAPYPIEKNQTKLPKAAPVEKSHCWSPN